MRQATVKKNNNNPELWTQFSQRLREGLLLLNGALALFLLLALLTYRETDPGWSSTGTGAKVVNAGGRAGAFIADFFLYFFGYVAYLLPVMIAYFAWITFYEQRQYPERHYPLLGLRWTGFIITLVGTSALLQLFLPAHHALLPFTSGGIIGDIVGGLLSQSLNVTGSAVLLLALVLGGVTLYSGWSWIKIGHWCWAHSPAVVGACKNRLMGLIHTYQQSKPAPVAPAMTEAEVVVVKAPAPRVKAKISERAAKERIEPSFNLSAAAPVVELPVAKPQAKPIPKPIKSISPIKSGGLPSLSLLDEYESVPITQVNKQELEDRSRQVEQRLADFGVVAQVVSVHPGPVVTRFELALAPGVKASKLTGLARDLARSLSMVSVRVVEIIPGKSVVGLELPNEKRAIVGLREVLESPEYEHAHSPLSLALGKDIAGTPIIVDLGKMPHLLVAGTTGSGKSVGVNAMLLSLLFKSTPAEVRMILVDPKMLELAIYEGIPHLLAPVVTDMREAANALRWCVAEMERRYRLMASLGVRNLAGFNQKINEATAAKSPILDPFAPQGLEDPTYLESLPYIVVIIDEFADMMMVVGKKVEQLIARIAQKARAAGIHLILATQRPSVDVITGLIKANIPTRISFQVSSKIDSRTIIDQQGAEQLLGHGDMLYLAPGTGVPVRVHGAFVADQEVHNVVNELKKLGSPVYIPDILEGMGDDEGDGEGDSGEARHQSAEQDPLYDEVVAFVIDSRRASTSSVQRRFKIGYNRAARIIDELERAKVVSAMENGGNREVLVPPLPRD